MTAIVYDYAAIAMALRGDDWWEPKRVEPLPECPVRLEYLDELSRYRSIVESITGLRELIVPPLKAKIPEAKWRLFYQGTLIT